ncbi:MAG: SdiA-regulated domain-containing protein [Chitinophagaceae bacterium]
MYRAPLFLLVFIVLVFACCNQREQYANPDGYDFNKGSLIKLPLELDEISGVAYYPKDTSVFSINDERGWLYKIGVGHNRNIQRWKFSSGGDFEDLVLLDSIFYVLQSNGDLTKISFVDSSLFVKFFPFTYKSENEFEILYYDDAKGKLILICKDCETDKKKSLTTFSFDPLTEQFSDNSFSIDTKQIAGAIGEKKIKFKPSAASINPRDSLLYIISSVNKLLVVTDRDGNFQKAYPLSSTLFKQPEGLTFTPEGTLIISNESAETGVANLLIFSLAKIRS